MSNLLLSIIAGGIAGAIIYVIEYTKRDDAPKFYLDLFYWLGVWIGVAILALSLGLWAGGVISGWTLLWVLAGIASGLVTAFVSSYVWPFFAGIASLLPGG